MASEGEFCQMTENGSFFEKSVTASLPEADVFHVEDAIQRV
jgi:hypothetical protein